MRKVLLYLSIMSLLIISILKFDGIDLYINFITSLVGSINSPEYYIAFNGIAILAFILVHLIITRIMFSIWVLFVP